MGGSHITTRQTTPPVLSTTFPGDIAVSFSVNATDTAGIVDVAIINTATNVEFTITFNQPYPTQPVVVVSIEADLGVAASISDLSFRSMSMSQFTLGFVTPNAAGMRIHYHVLGLST